VTIRRRHVVAVASLFLASRMFAQEAIKGPHEAPTKIQSPSPSVLEHSLDAEASNLSFDAAVDTLTDVTSSKTDDPTTGDRSMHTLNAEASDSSSKPSSDWQIDLYPVFAWTPIFGASASIPNFPNPLPGPTPSGSVSGSFNGAAFAGFGIEKNNWSATGNVLWAGLSGERESPFVRIDTNFIYGQMMLGREILPRLFVEVGFRRTAIKIAAKVSVFPQVIWKPGIWDPLVGLTYRRSLGKKWRFRIHGDGGGFGVGNDACISGTASTEWHFTRHFELLFGYGFLYFRNSGVIVGQPIKIKETLHGPMFGFGIHFGRR